MDVSNPTATLSPGRHHEEINIYIARLRLRYGWPINERPADWSPSKDPKSESVYEKCLGHIKFLYFRARRELDGVYTDLEELERSGVDNDELFQQFSDRLKSAIALVQGGLKVDKGPAAAAGRVRNVLNVSVTSFHDRLQREGIQTPRASRVGASVGLSEHNTSPIHPPKSKVHPPKPPRQTKLPAFYPTVSNTKTLANSLPAVKTSGSSEGCVIGQPGVANDGTPGHPATVSGAVPSTRANESATDLSSGISCKPTSRGVLMKPTTTGYPIQHFVQPKPDHPLLPRLAHSLQAKAGLPEDFTPTEPNSPTEEYITPPEFERGQDRVRRSGFRRWNTSPVMGSYRTDELSGVPPGRKRSLDEVRDRDESSKGACMVNHSGQRVRSRASTGASPRAHTLGSEIAPAEPLAKSFVSDTTSSTHNPSFISTNPTTANVSFTGSVGSVETVPDTCMEEAFPDAAAASRADPPMSSAASYGYDDGDCNAFLAVEPTPHQNLPASRPPVPKFNARKSEAERMDATMKHFEQHDRNFTGRRTEQPRSARQAPIRRPSQVDDNVISADTVVGKPLHRHATVSSRTEPEGEPASLLHPVTLASEPLAIDEKTKKKCASWFITELPKKGIYAPGVPPSLEHLPFHVLWECLRIAIHCGFGSLDELNYQYHNDHNENYASFAEIIKLQKIRMPPVPQGYQLLWEKAAKNQWEGISLYASLTAVASEDKPGPLFKLNLHPLEAELSCRFQRAWGADRILYLLIHPTKKLARDEAFKKSFDEWMLSNKAFLGRNWRVFHFGLKKAKNKNKPEEREYQRAVLFATDGIGLDRNTYHNGVIPNSPGFRRHAASISDFIDWFMPLDLNRHQSFCKLYSRLELGLSKTMATVVFEPGQIREIKDILSDSTPEDSQYNDPRLKWNIKYNPDTIMNDGCGVISVGAAKLVWDMLGIDEPLPSAFQGRIGPWKGVWIISAVSYTDDPEHLKIWIKVNDSQRKFNRHIEDKNPKTVDPNRVTLEVIDRAKAAKSAALHSSFIQILFERGVSRDTISAKVLEYLNFERQQIQLAMFDRRTLYSWVFKNFVQGDRPIEWLGRLPDRAEHKATLLLESGFMPRDCDLLADEVKELIRRYLERLCNKLAFPLGRSTHLLGCVPDTAGILNPGEVHISFSKPIIDPITKHLYSDLNNVEVIVGRQPALGPPDLQKVRAVHKRELDHLKDVIVMPVNGCFPLAGKMQGGDYDGDTFWITWDLDVVKPFKNAPVQIQREPPEYFGIKKDTRRLADLLLPHNNVDTFLAESFKFKRQPDLLGVVTNYLEAYSYHHSELLFKDESEDTPATASEHTAKELSKTKEVSHNIEALMHLHDYLVDSAKNGYIYDNDALGDFKKKMCMPRGRLPDPAYKTLFDDLEKKETERVGEYKAKEKNIVDYIAFQVADRHIKMTQELCGNLLRYAIQPNNRANVTPADEDLTCFYEAYKAPTGGQKQFANGTEVGPHERSEVAASSMPDALLVEELRTLVTELKKVHKTWKRLCQKRERFHYLDTQPSEFRSNIQQCSQMYCAIKPTTDSPHPLVRDWARWQGVDHSLPTQWEKLKASALYTLFPTNTVFIYALAGKELCYLKADRMDSEARVILADVKQTLRPVKPKRALGRLADYDVEPEDHDDIFSVVELD